MNREQRRHNRKKLDQQHKLNGAAEYATQGTMYVAMHTLIEDLELEPEKVNKFMDGCDKRFKQLQRGEYNMEDVIREVEMRVGKVRMRDEEV